jgi:hypothetical protein
MDILMKAGREIADLEGWNDEKEEIPSFRGKKPRNEPKWVYFVRDGLIAGRAEYIDYRYEKVERNIQNEPMEGMAFVVKGLLVRPSNNIEVPKNILTGRWLWRYIRNTPEFEGLNEAIGESFKD